MVANNKLPQRLEGQHFGMSVSRSLMKSSGLVPATVVEVDH